MIKILVLLLSIVPFIAHSNSNFCENHTPISTETMDGEKFGLVIPGSKIRKTQAWSPEEMVSPPLTTYGVYALVNDWAVYNLPKFDGIEIRSMELLKYACRSINSDKEYWYYIVEYYPLLDGNKMLGSNNYVGVLMSGEVIGVKSI